MEPLARGRPSTRLLRTVPRGETREDPGAGST